LVHKKEKYVMAQFDMVFEGGGAKGAVFLGAMQVIEEQKHTTRRLIGTSAGAITATLLAAGYDAEELMTVVLERLPDGKPRFTSFLDTPEREDFTDEELNASLTQEILNKVDIPFVPNWMEKRLDQAFLRTMLRNRDYRKLFSFVERGGIFEGRAILDWFDEKLGKKGLAKGITFKQFAEQKQADLSLVASDTSDEELLVLNHRTAPDLPVAWGVRMSMSIPFVWQEVLWKKEWGTYCGRTKIGNTVVDGGVLSNFPIRLIVDPDEDEKEIMGAAPQNKAQNLGMLIDEKLGVPGEPAKLKNPKFISRLKTVQRVMRILDTLMGASDNEMIRRYSDCICHLPAKGYGTLEFDLAGERLEHFMDAGRTAMTAHLKKRGLF
jgi:predicted acylesterase/phospholipase RssA